MLFTRIFALFCSLIVLSVLLFPCEIKAESEFRVDKSYGGSWHDAEKSKKNTNDDWLCWASSAANVLAWSKWGIVAGFETEDEIFTYFAKHWSDNPAGSPREAWRWWFSGKNHDSRGAKVVVEGGGFWREFPFPSYKWECYAGELFCGIGQNQLKRDPFILRRLLENGYAIVLQIVQPQEHGGRDSHMITLWGFRYDWLNRFTGILVTDSDDAKESFSAVDAPNTLAYYPVKLKGNEWWLTYREKQWKILAAYALLSKSEYLKQEAAHKTPWPILNDDSINQRKNGVNRR